MAAIGRTGDREAQADGVWVGKQARRERRANAEVSWQRISAAIAPKPVWSRRSGPFRVTDPTADVGSRAFRAQAHLEPHRVRP